MNYQKKKFTDSSSSRSGESWKRDSSSSLSNNSLKSDNTNSTNKKSVVDEENWYNFNIQKSLDIIEDDDDDDVPHKKTNVKSYKKLEFSEDDMDNSSSSNYKKYDGLLLINPYNQEPIFFENRETSLTTIYNECYFNRFIN
tara:strand:+ start:56 stop:478 length:423 start_codon:yes stop_codon:yes gene_type:complete